MGATITLDSGTYISTPDVNLLGAYTAHLEHNDGLWDTVFNLTRAWSAVAVYPFTPYFGNHALKLTQTSASASVVRTNKNNVPVSAATEYTFIVRLYSEDAVTAQLKVDQYDNVSGGTFIGSSALAGTAVPISAGTAEWLTLTATSHANAASWDLKVEFAGSAHAIDDVTWLDVACLRLGSSTDWLPSLRIEGTAGESKTPADIDDAFAGDGSPLTVGDGWAGDAVSYIRYDGAAGVGPIVAKMDANDAVTVGDTDTWVGSVDGRTWTVNGAGAVLNPGDEPSSGRLLVLGLL